MIPLSLKQLSIITYGMLYHIKELDANNLWLTNISINSKEKNISGLFIALKGNKFDGHDFIKEAILSGAIALLVNYPLSIAYPQVVVHDTQLAIGQIAFWIKSQSNAKVIGITGSSGKTSTKEMVASILTEKNMTLFTKGNYNNYLGVSLTLFRLTLNHKYIVLEIGANRMNEIKYISQMIKPDSVLINNIHISHLDGFSSLYGIAQAKAEIFYGLQKYGTAIINLNSHQLSIWNTFFSHKQNIWFFSTKKQKKSHFYAKNIFSAFKQIKFILHTPIGEIPIILPLIGNHNIDNAIAASALSISAGATLKDIKNGLINLKPIPGRLFPITIMTGKTIIDDTYNANMGSMIEAINVLNRMPGYRIFVVSDMHELGNNTIYYHSQIGKIIKKMNFNMVLSIGVNSVFISKYSLFNKHFFSKKKLITELINLIKINKIISVLIKGSHSNNMKDIVLTIKDYFLC